MIGNMIQKIRKEKGITKTELAKRAGINIGHLTHIEKGERNPSPETAVNFCKVLDCQFDEIFFINNDYKSNQTKEVRR